jgi:cytochrome c oxidase subunit II
MSRLMPLLPARARRSLRTVGLAGLLLLLAAGCASNAPLDTFQPEGPEARTIMNLVLPVFIVAGVIFVLVEGAILFILWRFRQRRDHDPDELPHQLHGNTRLEIGWTVLPAVILAPIAVFTVFTIFELEDRDDDAVRVEVVGNQWWWEFRYDVDGDGTADIITATEMVVPAGRQVDLAITSNDVIHSFWIPRLNGKRDAVPGRVHTWSITADEPGYYWGQCTEFCGLSHAVMRMRVVAVPEEDYQAWIERQLEPGPTPQTAGQARGQELFAQVCASCHRIAGLDAQPSEDEHPLVAGVAPDLTHFASRRGYAGGIFELYNDDMTVNRGQLEAWLRNAPAEKPMAPNDGRGMPNLGLTESQIDDLVEYLLSTSPEGPVWTGPRTD